MRLFLTGTCDDVTRWLPPPQWEPAWQSEAARECRNGETGPSGAWGEHTVRTVYAGAALYLDTILRCIQAMAGALTAQSTPYVMNALARAAMEAGAQLWWLLQPDIGVRRRVARFWLIRASGARYLDDTVRIVDPAALAGTYGETSAMVQAAVDGLGLSYSERQLRNGRWSRSCEGETLPGYTARAAAFETAVSMSAAYTIYSAAAYAEWHAVIASFRQEPLPGGGSVLLSRPRPGGRRRCRASRCRIRDRARRPGTQAARTNRPAGRVRIPRPPGRRPDPPPRAASRVESLATLTDPRYSN